MLATMNWKKSIEMLLLNFKMPEEILIKLKEIPKLEMKNRKLSFDEKTGKWSR